MSNKSVSAKSGSDTPDWVASRRAGNVRIAIALVAIAVAFFAIAIWKYRPI